MKTKHTPGPWKSMDIRDARNNPCAFAVWPVRERGPLGDNRNIYNQICRTPDGLTPENEANARLIAAAPELLSACVKMIESWDCRCPEAGIVAIQAAIHKATGEA